MTAKSNITQYKSMPSRCCHTNTDRPNEAPNDNATVPTMTSAATRLRVMNNMIRKNEAERRDAGDDQVVARHVRDVLVGGRRTADVDLRPRQRRALDRLLRRMPHRINVRNAL